MVQHGMAWHGTIASFGEAAQGDRPSLALETAEAQHSRPLVILFPHYPLAPHPPFSSPLKLDGVERDRV